MTNRLKPSNMYNMTKSFEFLNIAHIDAKLKRDLLKNEDKLRIIYLIVFIFLLYVFHGWILYWLHFGIAFSKLDKSPINTQKEPIQINFNKQEQNSKIFEYKSLINSNTVTIIPMADYKLAGTVVAYNRDFFFRSEFFDSMALYDIGISWGKLANKEFFTKHIKTYSQKVEMTGSRRLNWSWNQDIGLDNNYISSHISHSHIIPANRNIMAALLTIKEWDKVELTGQLVDMRFIDKKNRIHDYRTSLSREDDDNTSRGNGACETIYLTKIKIGNKLYK